MRLAAALALLLGLLAPLGAAQTAPAKADAVPVAVRSVDGPPAAGRIAAAAPVWDDRFGLPSLSLYGAAAAVAPDGDLYVGGYMSSVSGLDARGIARWDGRRWHTLGAGVDGTVYAIAVAADGSVFVGGDFTIAGGVRADGIARWSPATQTWSALGGAAGAYGSRGVVYALTAAPDGSVYAGGDFLTIGGVTAGNVARYAGGTWQPLGTGVGSLYSDTFDPDGGTVYALAVDGDAVYVGGRFHGAEGARSTGVIRWDAGAGTWTALGDVLDTYGGMGVVRALAAADGAVWVGGAFVSAGGVAVANVARYDGAAWQALGLGLEQTYGATVSGLALDGGRLVATGTFDTAGGRAAAGVATWDGAAWAELGGGLEAAGRAVVPSADGLYVIGDFDEVGGGVRAESVARWTGAEWRALGLGVGYASIEGTVRAMAWAGDLLVVGGGFDFVGGRPVANVAAWDGADWRGLGTGFDGTVHALVVGADGAVYAGGEFTTAGGVSASRIARWDGAAWAPLGGGLSGPVYSLAVGPDGALYVGGSFSSAGAVAARNVARWDGAAWSALGVGADGRVNALAVADDGTVFVGGDLDETAGLTTNGIAAWTGTAWVPLGEGVQGTGTHNDYPGEVYALAFADGYLYVGGDFDKAGPAAAAGVARFDGAAWSGLGAGLGGGDREVYALYADGPDVYVGGSFTTAGGQASPTLARWTSGADTWASAGGGVVTDDGFGKALALAAFGDALFVGGRYLQSAGGQPVAGVARWGGALVGAPVAGRLVVDPDVLDFGTVAIGATATQTLTLRNAGDAPLAVTVGAPTGAAAFAVAAGGGAVTLAPGATRTVTLAFSPAEAGAAEGALALPNDGAGGTVAVALRGLGARNAPVVVRRFDPAGPQLLWAAGGTAADGFVFGTNRYGDRAKAVVLAVPDALGGRRAAGAVTEVRVWFAYQAPTPGDRTYDVALYAGDETTGPVGAPLASETFRLADVAADDDPETTSGPTVHRFARPVAVDGPFVVVVDFGSYDEASLAAIAAGPRVGARVPEVWEALSDGAWINVSDSWTGAGVAGAGTDGWQPWIEADVAPAGATAADDGPALATGLEAVRPNPAPGTATVAYALAEAGPVAVRVFDLLGREVAVLADGPAAAGRHEVRFSGAGLASGVYMVRFEAGGTLETRRLTLVR